MNENGEFLGLTYDGKEYSGKELLDFLDHQVNKAYFGRKHGNWHQDACDFMWYLWCGSKSPLFGKSKLAMFENYFINDDEAKVEKYNAYFHLSQDEMVCKKILKEFGLDADTSHIINGHVPVKTKDGENPVRANGRLINIDGGLSKAYQTKTGIAGYTLIYNSHSLSLAEHKSFNFEFDKVISPAPEIIVVESMGKRILVGETDNGKLIQEKIDELRELLKHFRNGTIKEKK
jgi:fructose-1,6-bisphosphatase-3